MKKFSLVLLFTLCLITITVCSKEKVPSDCPSSNNCEDLPTAPVCAIQKLPGEQTPVFVKYERECNYRVAECNIKATGGEIRRDPCPSVEDEE